jgi:ketosteroid isomerase-like protein
MALTVVVGIFSIMKDTIASQEHASAEKSLLALETGAMEWWRNGDPMGWAAISAPEVTYVDPSLTKPIVGREEYAGYLEKLKGKIHYQGSEFIQPKVEVYGDVAVLTYVYRATVEYPDGAGGKSTLWNTTEVYARLGGEWKIIHTHWSYLNHGLPDRLEMPLPVELAPKTYTGVLGELVALESSAMERYRKGDPFGFTDISVPAVTYFDTGTPQRVDGLDALKGEMGKRIGQTRYDVMEFIEPMVQIHGDTAVFFYRFLSTSLRPDGSIDRRMPWNCTEVFSKIDGAWRIVHTHWSLINGRPNKPAE